MPDFAPDVLFDKLDEFLLEFEEHDREIFGGVMVVGDAAEYANVWEWGNIRQTKPGPKTVIGTNPEGKMVWLSSQAPFGYIRVNADQYWDAIRYEMERARFDQPDARAMTVELEKVAFRASKHIAEIVAANAPRDSGNLAESIQPVNPTDTILEGEDNFGVLGMEGM